MTKLLTTAAAIIALSTTGALAQNWKLDSETSHLAFGSVKNSYIGEVHTFSGLTGSATRDGAVEIEIPLASLQTNIDIRNERMTEHVFAFAPNASITAQIDMDAVDGLRPGEATIMELDAVLTLGGNDVDLYTNVFVMRTSGRSVMVSTNDMILVDTDTMGVDGGIDMLQQLANLDSITRVTPITARFIFER